MEIQAIREVGLVEMLDQFMVQGSQFGFLFGRQLAGAVQRAQHTPGRSGLTEIHRPGMLALEIVHFRPPFGQFGEALHHQLVVPQKGLDVMAGIGGKSEFVSSVHGFTHNSL